MRRTRKRLGAAIVGGALATTGVAVTMGASEPAHALAWTCQGGVVGIYTGPNWILIWTGEGCGPYV